MVSKWRSRLKTNNVIFSSPVLFCSLILKTRNVALTFTPSYCVLGEASGLDTFFLNQLRLIMTQHE